MVNIFRSDLFIGSRVFIEDNPDVFRLSNHIFNPSSSFGCAAGIYDYGRRVVNASLYFRGPDPESVFPGLTSSFQYYDIRDWAEEEEYIYLGPLHTHFGHFLLSTLSRLWSIRDMPKGLKILCHDDGTIGSELKKGYVKDLFAALDIDLDRIMTLKHPVRIKSIILPCPSFEERNFVHRVFAVHCNQIGDKLEQTGGTNSRKPLYLSKAHIPFGVRKIINEEEIDNFLVKKGFEIAYPEQLAFSEQVSLWRKPRPILSFSGSGLHTSIFSRNAELVCLNYDRFVDTSFVLCDWANNTKAAYFFFEEDALESLGSSPDFGTKSGFSSLMRARNPQAVADCIARALDGSSISRNVGEQTLILGHQIISAGKPTSQSSYLEERDMTGLSATSGFLTGRYQVCTKHEAAPWLQIDLEQDCQIKEIVVFNRTDSAPERSSHLCVSYSSDGISFNTIFERNEQEPFGGLNGEPLRIKMKNSVSARYVRFSTPDVTFLHLDQVTIFGEVITVI